MFDDIIIPYWLGQSLLGLFTGICILIAGRYFLKSNEG